MPDQLSFSEAFEQAASEERTRYLPATMVEGIGCYRNLIERFNETMLVADLQKAQALIDEACLLARKLNGGDPAIFADIDSAGNILERETAAVPGEVSLWGQTGEFIVSPRDDLQVLIQMEGMLALPRDPVPSFCAHAMDVTKPFISPTGFQSFIGWRFPLKAGMTPDLYAVAAINESLHRHAKGKLCMIEARYRNRDLYHIPQLLRTVP